MKSCFACCGLLLFAVLFSTLNSPLSTLHAQGTAFTYQGRLNNGSSPANGSFDLTFALFATNNGGSAIGGPVTNVAAGVSNGLFTTMLDFGPGALNGGTNWLEIGVRSNGAGAFATLAPRQQLAPSPYAILAEGVIAGSITSAMLADGAVTGRKVDDGGSAAYQTFQNTETSNGGDTAVPFSGLSSFPAGSAPSMTLVINGSAFGTVMGFSGTEAMSAPYSFLVQVQSAGVAVSPDTKIGLPAQLTFTRNGHSTAFGGIVTGCTLSASDSSGLIYLVRIESSLSYLALSKDFNIFQDQTAVAAATKVYQTATGNTLSQSLTATYAVHDMMIQYAETGLNFFNRLMENEGVFYFFNQSVAPPTLTLGDSTSAYLSAPNSPFFYYGNTSTNTPSGGEYIRSFQKSTHQSTLKSLVNSYDFTQPNTSLAASNASTVGIGENFEFGNAVATVAYNQQLANVRQAREGVERSLIEGSATTPDLRPGYVFTLVDLTGAGLGGSYVVTAAHHAGFVRVTNGVSSFFYGNQFEAMPSSITFHPALGTPKPQAHASEAVITGAAGDTIHVDKYARVKVQFHWDRRGKNDDNSSAWLRIATPMAGGNHSMLFLPQVGDEVVVSFIEGDPDQPIVTGSLINSNSMPPYSLPGNKTVSTIQTISTDGQVNEVEFDDRVGAELLALHAAKDFNTTAVNNQDQTVGGNLTASIGNNATAAANNVTVSAGNSVTVSANTMTFKPVTSLSVTGNVAIGLTTTPAARLEVSSSGNIGTPQLRLDQTLTSDFSRIRMVSGSTANGVWDIAAGGSPPNVLNFFVGPGIAIGGTNILTLFPNGNATLWGTLAQGSDRNHKENITPIDTESLLDRVARLPISAWNYKTEPGVQHIGPMAQDFYSLFKVGADDTHITTIDEGGVALGAIQGLNQSLKEKEAEIRALQERIDRLEKLLESGQKKTVTP